MIDYGVLKNKDEISVSPLAFGLRRTDGVRMDLIRRIRAEIEAGVYEKPAKLDAALEALLLLSD